MGDKYVRKPQALLVTASCTPDTAQRLRWHNRYLRVKVGSPLLPKACSKAKPALGSVLRTALYTHSPSKRRFAKHMFHKPQLMRFPETPCFVIYVLQLFTKG